MQTATSWIRRLLGLLIVPAALAMPLAAAPAAWAQDEGGEAAAGDGGDEEDFYRQSDPEEPTGPAAKPPAPKVYTVQLTLRMFQPMGETSDMDAEGLAPAIGANWLWSALDQDYWLGLEVGVELGVLYNYLFEINNITPAEFEQVKSDFEVGIEDVTAQPLNSIAADVITLYGGPLVRVDFTGPSPIDVGFELMIGYQNTSVDSEWNCTQCPFVGLDQGSGSADVGGGILRFGGYITYQFEWFNVGANFGFVAFLGGDLPATSGYDFGISLGVRF